MKVEAFIFDLGGTLIQYKGFPLFWGDYYEQAFTNVNRVMNLGLSIDQLESAKRKLLEYNPRINP